MELNAKVGKEKVATLLDLAASTDNPDAAKTFAEAALAAANALLVCEQLPCDAKNEFGGSIR